MFCDGCTLCCHRDAVRLLAGDEGCTIHGTKPQMCREMDCRRIAQAVTWTQALKMEARGTLRMGPNDKLSGKEDT